MDVKGSPVKFPQSAGDLGWPAGWEREKADPQLIVSIFRTIAVVTENWMYTAYCSWKENKVLLWYKIDYPRVLNLHIFILEMDTDQLGLSAIANLNTAKYPGFELQRDQEFGRLVHIILSTGCKNHVDRSRI